MVEQLSVDLPSFVWDDWGYDHWFPVNMVESLSPACFTMSNAEQQASLGLPVISQEVSPHSVIQ